MADTTENNNLVERICAFGLVDVEFDPGSGHGYIGTLEDVGKPYGRVRVDSSHIEDLIGALTRLHHRLRLADGYPAEEPQPALTVPQVAVAELSEENLELVSRLFTITGEDWAQIFTHRFDGIALAALRHLRRNNNGGIYHKDRIRDGEFFTPARQRLVNRVLSDAGLTEFRLVNIIRGEPEPRMRLGRVGHLTWRSYNRDLRNIGLICN